MQKFSIIIILVITLLSGSCTERYSNLDLETLTLEYYEALNESDFDKIKSLQYDSVRVGGEDYQMVYSLDDYTQWLEWDSVFNPSYEISELNVIDGKVEAVVSKSCKRIQFLNEAPTVTKEVLSFKDGKIFSLTVAETISFNEEKWLENRESILTWIRRNHPEIDEFIYDQSKQGAINYSNAIDLYLNNKEFTDQ